MIEEADLNNIRTIRMKSQSNQVEANQTKGAQISAELIA